MDLNIKKDLASNWFKLLQNAICDDIIKLEKNKLKFKSTTWKRNKDKDEGGGEYRIIKDGKIFEKVGVNFSKVHGSPESGPMEELLKILDFGLQEYQL